MINLKVIRIQLKDFSESLNASGIICSNYKNAHIRDSMMKIASFREEKIAFKTLILFNISSEAMNVKGGIFPLLFDKI